MLLGMSRSSWIAYAAVAAVAVIACSGAQKPPEPSEAEPPWVKDYQRIAEEGCACGGDEDCLNEAHAAASAMEAEHGGIDDAPPSVQVAHGELDKCWREGTLDLGRDLGDAADAVCKCADSECVNLYKISVMRLQEKYRVDLAAPAGLEPGPREAAARADACIAKVSIPVEELVQAYQRRAATMCRCETLHCAETSEKLDFGARFYVANMDRAQTDVEMASDRYCSCLSEILAKDRLRNAEDQPERPKDAPKVDVSLDRGKIRCPE
jgi:hypothetical protein